MDIVRIREQIERDLETTERHLAAVVGQRSISEGNRGVEECAELLVEMHREMGFDQVEIYRKKELPNVFAYMDAGAEKTLGVYLMFDHAVPGKGWTRDPYSAEVEALDPYPRVMYGHGIGTKGPYIAFAAAVAAMKRLGVLPFNVACLMEGEEFVGSTHYRHMVKDYRDRLEPCVGAIMPSAGQGKDGGVSLSLGSKGCAYFELVSRGSTAGKGPITASVHSSAQGVVHSPPWRLAEALASLVKPGSWGLEMAFDGFYDGVALPEGEELEMALEAFAPLRGTDLRKTLPGIAGRGEVAALFEGLDEEDLFLRVLYYPTFNINGIRSGYVDIDSPLFSLPGEARARLDMRFGKDQSGDYLMESLRRHLDEHGFEDIEIVDMGVHDASVAELGDDIIRAAQKTYEDCGAPVKSVWPIRPAGAPLGDFCTVLGAPALGAVGIGMVGSNAGEQYMVLEGDGAVAGLAEGVEFFCRYLANLAEVE